MEIEPVQVLPAAIPAGLTETVKLVPEGPAVKAPVGERLSQLLLVQVCSVACAVALVLPGAVTVSVCEAGADPPAIALNEKFGALNVSPVDPVEPEPEDAMFRVTGAVRTPDAAFTK